MFVRLAARAAESEETYFMAVNNAEKLAKDVEKSLKIRADPDLDNSSCPQATQQNDKPGKPRGIKVKQKTVRGSARPIGGFEKATRESKKTKKDPKEPGSAIEAEIITHSQPQYTILGHLGTPTVQNHMHTPGYYPVGNASLPSFGSWLGVPQHGQDTQQGNATQSFNINPYNVFNHFH
ncbi:uncharacterized protein LOC133923600 [Phragmites australis]|uniref:uncharacterized protein LOC133923600 n=1 Tax=Phragmites australis TaxID=29695 RepID=UPI002D769283|nr:uncharacterized protein LOC133923600 [Phragmites australis]